MVIKRQVVGRRFTLHIEISSHDTDTHAALDDNPKEVTEFLEELWLSASKLLTKLDAKNAR